MMLKQKKYSKNLSNYFVKEIKLILLIFEKKKKKVYLVQYDIMVYCNSIENPIVLQ